MAFFYLDGLLNIPTLGVFNQQFTFNLILGNEVRNVVPEPSTGLMLAMGLGLLGIAGSGRRVARRTRKAGHAPSRE